MASFEPTEEQRRVIAFRGAHSLVFAGPGTGKTETLARRFAAIVHDDGLPAASILVLTFSRRAAHAMRQRIVRRLRERAGGSIAVPELHVYTFHGYCARLLDGDRPRGSRRRLLTPVKERLIWNRIITGLELVTFAPDVVQSTGFATAVLNFIARHKGDGVSPAEVTREAGDDPRMLDLARLYRLMDDERTRLGLSDFRDLVADAVRALEDPASAANAWLAAREPLKHVLVDEFQDSDPMQLRLLEALAGPARTATPPTPEMCFVGDFNQSIYRFRGATPENIDRARALFRCHELTLRLNRRSVQPVLDVANRTPRLRPDSLTQADPANARAGAVRLLQVETVDDEVSAIADAVGAAVRAGTKPSDIAVLLRVVEPYRGAIARELQARGIPVAAQSTAGFHEDSLVAAALSCVRILAGEADAGAWRRLLTNPLVGFRPLDVSLALTAGGESGPYRALEANPPAGRLAWAEFAKRLEACRPAMGSAARFEPAALFQAVVRELDLLWPIRDRREVPGFDRSASPARLHALVQAAHDVREMADVEKGPRLTPASFTEQLDSLLPLLGDPYEEPQSEGPGVPVMSIHAAKGLEFDMVVVPQLIDGVLPARTFADPLIGGRPSRHARDADDALLEESSLWYVALTRARFHVIATAARLGDDAAELALSQFAQLIGEADLPAAACSDRTEHLGFAAAYDAAGETERAEPRVAAYLARRPVLEAFLRRRDLPGEAARSFKWPLDRLSPTSIETYIACPRHWFYKYAMQLSGDDDDSTRMGRFAHRVLERYHTEVTDFTGTASGGLTADRIVAALKPIADEESRRAAAESGLTAGAPLYRYEAARIERQLAAYARWLESEARARPFAVLACERMVEVDLGGMRLIGKVDRVDRLADGSLAIRDYKTGKKHHDACKEAVQALAEADPSLPGLGLFGVRTDGLLLQTYLYVRAVETMFDGTVARADYLYLAGTGKDREDISVDSTSFADAGGKNALSRADLDAVYDVIAAGVAREVSGGELTAFPTAVDADACKHCAYTSICPGPGSIGYPR